MSDKPWQKQMYDFCQRLGMKVAEKPQDQRDAAYVIVERHLREMLPKAGLNVPPENVDRFVEIQMQVVREIVDKIDLSGSNQGGRA